MSGGKCKGVVRKRRRPAVSNDCGDPRLDQLSHSKIPRVRPQVALWKATPYGGDWLVTDGILPEGKIVSCADVKKRFRRFTLAAILYAWTISQNGEPLPFESVDELVMCVAAGFTEDDSENNKHRFAVYRCMAGLLGYRERTKLPHILEIAVKKEFPDEEARYVGFQP